ncbi:MAG TPA: hypothetical protein VGX21_04295 [Methylomirabilota bacterium]|jgi:hypothetical protein|nr:hypothetical protein [Methylomirabilota bacterium]
MRYVEERDFTLRLDLRCEFPEGYEGDQDGYAWLRDFHGRIAPQLVQAAVQAIRAQPGWTVRVGNRGRAVEDEVTLIVERIV